jgi:hypothetical protein
MSKYFFHRIKNLPTSVNSSNNNNSSRLVQPKVKSDEVITISDDELLDSVLKFEQTPQFKRAEEDAKKARGEYTLNFSNHSHQFIQNLKSISRVFVDFINNQMLHHLSKVRSFDYSI